MPRGGARINSGPPPDPQALRRDRQSDKDGWTLLPSEGREGVPPKWPLAAIGAKDEEVAEVLAIREREVWTEIWHTPQAVAWHRLGWTHDVALYVRMLVLGEGGSTKALAEVRQWSDRLGLNPSAMLRNRWKIADDQVSERREQRQQPAGGSARDRLKAIDGGAASR